MKRSLRPLFSLLLLFVSVVTLTCRVAIRGSFRFSSTSSGSSSASSADFGFHPPPLPTVFNSTLLRFAAIDIGEAKTRQEIDQLLDGDYPRRRGQHRRVTTWRGTNHHENRNPRYGSGLPALARSPYFHLFWLDFRKNLKNWSRNKGYQPDIMADLIRLVKHPIDKHSGLVLNLNGRYSSCAVVGNSGILLDAELGGLIDSNEFVIRLNNARTEKFERFVGSKTSVSFINSNILHLCGRSERCYCHPYGSNVPTVMYICQPNHLFDYTVCGKSYESPLIITDRKFDLLCSRIVKYYSAKRFVEVTGKPLEEWSSNHDGSLFHYSSGMQAVMLALGICDKVNLFGFGKKESAKHHYHTNQKTELQLHDYEAEYDFYRDLVEHQGAIPFISEKFKIPPVVVYQ